MCVKPYLNFAVFIYSPCFRARDKALQREARDLDDLTVEYSSALKEVNPRLINTLYKTYQEKVRIPSTGQLVQMADERKLDYEDRYDGYSSEDRHRARRPPHGENTRRHWHSEHHRSSSNRDWAEAPPVSEQMNLQPREPHVFDLQTALGPRRTLRAPTGSSRHIGDPWASADSRDPPRRSTHPVDRPELAHNRREEDFEAENALPSNALAPQDKWKSTTVASTREIPTGHTKPSVAIDRSKQDGWTEAQNVNSGSDDSDDGAGGIRRVVSRSEFAAVPVPVQPILRTLSVRSINVNAEAVATPRPEEPTSSTNRGPQASASVDVSSRDGWGPAPLHSNALHPNADRNFSTARLAPVQQSTSEMSHATTAMSVDSLNPRMTPVQAHSGERTGTGHADRGRYREEEEDDVGRVVAELSRNNESYENIDMSSFINANNASRISRASERDDTITSVERYIADDMRDLEAERFNAKTNSNSNLNTLNSTGGDSFMVEEFDDSLHMDHRPISGFNSSEPQPEHHRETLRVSTGASTPGRAPLLPPSASKSTPVRPERGGMSPGDYSMSHDSPFPDLSGGKDFNRLMGGAPRGANHSHISSNASTSRNYNNHTGASDSYDQDTFEDEDDPFGRGGSGPQRTLDLTNVTGGSTDIDASKSITIDFVLPSESKDLQRHAATRSSDGGAMSQYGVSRSSRYAEPDSFSGELDLFSPLGGPRSMTFGGARGPGSRGMGDDDDDVLMGTTKLSSTGRGDFTNTFQSRATLGGSDRYEQDSLGGTFASNPNSNPTRGNVASFSPMAEIAGGAEGEEEEEESIPPPTYDSMIGTGNTDDSLRASNSQLQQSQLSHEEVSSYFEVSADASTHPHLLDIHNVQTEAEAAGIKAPGWQVGRAPVDAIELATAFDVFVSAVRLDAQHARIYSEVKLFDLWCDCIFCFADFILELFADSNQAGVPGHNVARVECGGSFAHSVRAARELLST